MSQPELARALDMSLASLRRVEQETRDVTTAELLHIGEVCEVPRRFMLYGWTEPGKSTTQSQNDALVGIISDMEKRLKRHEEFHSMLRERFQLTHPDADHVAVIDPDAPPDTPDLAAQLDDSLRAGSVASGTKVRPTGTGKSRARKARAR